jgi:hypothetical protein
MLTNPQRPSSWVGMLRLQSFQRIQDLQEVLASLPVMHPANKLLKEALQAEIQVHEAYKYMTVAVDSTVLQTVKPGYMP